jgi:hypothetical protein
MNPQCREIVYKDDQEKDQQVSRDKGAIENATGQQQQYPTEPRRKEEMGNYDNRIQQKEILGDKTHKHPSAQTTLKNGFSEARCE